ncbi:hypothetical protein N510_001307 [Firmicutes bacterium ASF500]|nr:hypothetical protein N510_001307 [Firmicutes bacterium ASF500]
MIKIIFVGGIFKNMYLDNDCASFRVSREELDEAYAKMTGQELDDLRQAAQNIRAFARAQLGCLSELEKLTIIPGS